MKRIGLVSGDDADWITPVSERCLDATMCLAPFHIVKVATETLTGSRDVCNDAR